MATQASGELPGGSVGGITLHGEACHACGSVFFPPLRWGCEVCGASETDLVPRQLSSAGQVYAWAVVEVHDHLPTPYTLVDVVLDEGPRVRGLAEGTDLAIGQRVELAHGAATDTRQDPHDMASPRFVPRGFVPGGGHR